MGSMDVGTVEQGEASAKMPSPVSPVRRFTAASVRRFADVNRELWLLLSLFLLAALLNSMTKIQRIAEAHWYGPAGRLTFTGGVMRP